MNNYVKKSVRLLQPYHVEKENVDVKLDANENPYNIFEELQKDFIREIKNLNINRYPDTDSDKLRLAIARHTGLKKENVICGNGSDELIQIILNSFVDKGENVLTYSPTFTMYKTFTNIIGGNVIEVSCEDNFQVSEDEIIKQANEKKVKIIFLCNPNNPTGTLIPKKVIQNILKNTKSIVVVDEAYYEFSGETVKDWIYIYDRLIVLRTLSKAFALAGARIGYGIASEKMMNVLYRVKSPYNLNMFSQIVGKLYIEKVDFIKQHIDQIKEERTYLFEQLCKIEDIEVFPTSSNFILIRTSQFEKILNMCKKEKIALRAFRNEDLLKDCIRITVGKREENDVLLNIIRKVVQ